MPPQHKQDGHDADLLNELQENNAFFDSVVDMIPANLYVSGNSDDAQHHRQQQHTSKYHKGQNKESKEAKRARNKAAKRAKYDPKKQESTRQVKERKEKEVEQGEDNDDNEDIMEEEEEDKKTVDDDDSKNKDAPSSSSRIEALRAKLRAKLAEKCGQRPSDPSAVSKRAARRAEKQRHQEEAKKRKAASKTQVKDAKSAKFTTTADDKPPTTQDDLSNVDFGKLAGLNAEPKNYANNKSLANLSKKKNIQKLLADAEEKRQRLEELKKGSEEEKARAAKIQWSDTFKEASGERIKDDPAKLRKQLKRKAAKKEKSAKAWKSRMEQGKQKMEERQKIRMHNLDKRKAGGAVGANLSKKRIVTEADAENNKGRRGGKSRAGFEGKKQDFINKKQNNQ